MHTLLDLKGRVPSFIHSSDGKLHDVLALDLLMPEAGANYVMDRASVDFERLHALHLAEAFFVTRTQPSMEVEHGRPPRLLGADPPRSTHCAKFSPAPSSKECH